MEPAPDDDPVLAHRARIVHWAGVGRRVGYACFAGAMAVFFVALLLDLPTWSVAAVVGLMALGSAVLLPAIILGYGAKAADKEDRGEPFGY